MTLLVWDRLTLPPTSSTVWSMTNVTQTEKETKTMTNETIDEVIASAKTQLYVPGSVTRTIRRSADAWEAFHAARPEILKTYTVAEDPTRGGGWIVRPL